MLYHWDSVNFALGIQHFDVRMHQPHPPGYILYVMLGRAVNVFVQDPNASLVWLSVFFSGLTAGVLFLLGKTMFSRLDGGIAVALLLSSPLFWFHGEVALTYVLEAFFTTTLALMSYRMVEGDRRYIHSSAALLGIAGGIRQSTLLFMLPVWLFSIRRFSWKQVGLAILVLGVTVGAWFIPMVVRTGGIGSYLRATTGTDVIEESPLLSAEQVVVNAIRIGAYGFYGLLLGGLPLAYGAIRSVRMLPELARDQRAQVMVLWILPALTFLVMVHIRQAGHVFAFLPALLMLTAVAVRESSQALVKVLRNRGRFRNRTEPTRYRVTSKRVLAVGTTLLVVANVLFFLTAPPYLLGIQRTVLHTPSLRSIQSHDRYLADAIGYIRHHFSPEETVIVGYGLSFRHPDYYLPEYTIDGPAVEKLDSVDRAYTTVLFGQVDVHSLEGTEAVRLPGGDTLAYLPASRE
jgi:hypothetical protein